MADYKELLRRAITALPENNGAARRAVYEKARSALVGQLRAITPPLPARDITQHRLQLEDCIRQVEQEASEAVITLGRDLGQSPRAAAPAAKPVDPPPVAPPEPEPVAPPAQEDEPVAVSDDATVSDAVSVEAPKAEEPPAKSEAAPMTSIEDIISQAAAATDAQVQLTEDRPAAARELKLASETRVMPAILARVQANNVGPTSPVPQARGPRTSEAAVMGPIAQARSEVAPRAAANSSAASSRLSTRVEPSIGNHALARQEAAAPEPVSEPVAVEAALSAVREVDVDPDASEAQGVIERAIEVLDREARGEASPQLSGPAGKPIVGLAVEDQSDDAGFVEPPEPRSGAGLTIFLVVFAILLAGVGGAGFWAWREGYVDLDQMFGQAQAPATEIAEVGPPATPTLDPVQPEDATEDVATGPGNTASTVATEAPSGELGGFEIEDRLEPTPEPVQPTGNETVLPDVNGGELKSEERLTGEETTALAVTDPAASVDPAVLAGSQSLLLEASQDGTTGAVPFSGTVEWSQGADELGLPTLVGSASIPARNLGVDITIRKNSDPSLPASHLMEVDFRVSDTFIGGTIATLPGVLLKDEELVPGTALVGASARVVGNSFLFALSATPEDVELNTDLLENQRWMDLAVVYGTGRNAILTLEKDEAAQALFDEVFATWEE
jgi:hypothetical protein